MTSFRLFGDTDELSEIAKEIMSQDIDALAARIANGWNINEPILLTSYSEALPITLALVEKKFEVLELLLNRNANLNDEREPAIVTAARCCEASTIGRLVALGARIDRTNSVGSNAFSAALYSERFDLLPHLVRLGLRVDADGGASFRQAVFARQRQAIQFFVENGVDVNAHPRDMVHPNFPTPLLIAAQHGDFGLVRYLVDHGADVCIEDEYGNRPYLAAVSIGHTKMQSYLEALEPPEWHDESRRIADLRKLGLPDALIDHLAGANRRLEVDGEFIRFVEFHSLLSTRKFRWNGRLYVDLLCVVDNYWEVGFLTWSPEDRKLVHVGIEYDTIKMLCDWPEFLKAPTRWVNAIFS